MRLSALPLFLFALLASSMAQAQGEEHASGGLPQFDPHWWPSQIFWLAVCFVILYVVFARRILPDIGGVLETRRAHIEGNIALAEKLKREAEEAKAAHEAGLDNARTEAGRIVAELHGRIKASAEASAQEYREAFERETAAMEKRLAKVKSDAMKDMNAIAAEIASEAAYRIVGISLDPKKARTVVEALNRREAA